MCVNSFYCIVQFSSTFGYECYMRTMKNMAAGVDGAPGRGGDGTDSRRVARQTQRTRLRLLRAVIVSLPRTPMSVCAFSARPLLGSAHTLNFALHSRLASTSTSSPYPFPQAQNPSPWQIFHLQPSASQQDIKARCARASSDSAVICLMNSNCQIMHLCACTTPTRPHAVPFHQTSHINASKPFARRTTVFPRVY